MTKKTTLKQKLICGMRAAGIGLYMSTIGAVIYGTSTYLKPIRTERTSISGCTIIETTCGAEFPAVKYITSKGEIREATLPKELERIVEHKIISEHKSIPATMESVKQIYSTRWGQGAEYERSLGIYVKSIEETK